MAANWWKYGLCVFGGLGLGYLAGVKITKNKAEEEYESRIKDIRDVYRNGRKASAPKAKRKDEPAKPEITTKTSIQMDRLSERKEKADQASRIYGAAFDQPENKPNDEKKEEDTEDTQDEDLGWKNHIRIVDEFPEDCDYPDQAMDYYADGVLAYGVTGMEVRENDIPHLIGKDALELLKNDGCDEVHVINDEYALKYTIAYRDIEYEDVKRAEPYKANL